MKSSARKWTRVFTKALFSDERPDRQRRFPDLSEIDLHAEPEDQSGSWPPDAKQQRLPLSAPRRKRPWFSGLWTNAAAPPVIPGFASG
jgi:hypothetical protein